MEPSWLMETELLGICRTAPSLCVLFSKNPVQQRLRGKKCLLTSRPGML